MGNTLSYLGSWNSTDSLIEADRAHLVNNSCIKEYDIKPPIGLALLLGCDRTSDPGDDRLSCVHKDLNLMEESLKHCGFKVMNPCLDMKSNEVTLTYKKCTKAFDDIRSDPQLEEYSSFLFYYSGHGISRGILLSDSAPEAPEIEEDCLPYKIIVTQLLSIQALKAKPKIFIFDCCRTKWNYKFFDSKIEVKSGGDRSFSRDTREVLADQREKQVYPPPDSVLCFSVTEGCEVRVQGGKFGSNYTRHLAISLKKWHAENSFTEIVHSVHAMLQSSGKEQPVLESTLNGRLILAAYRPPPSEPDPHQEAEGMEVNSGIQDIQQPTAIEVKGLMPRKPRLVTRDPNWPEKVMKDRAKRVPPIYRSKDDVMKNREKLGEDVSVFICYAPDPLDPFSDPREHQAEIHQHELQICNLINDLERHGFAVTADLTMPEGQLNALRWYASRIDTSDFVILICSPSFYQLVTAMKLSREVKDTRAKRLHSYSNALYGVLSQENDGVTKIVPVLLSDYNRSSSVPLLFQGGIVYNLFETGYPRTFDYSRDGPFENLVYRMAGIDKKKLNAPQDRVVHKLPKPYEEGSASAGASSDYQMYLERAQKPRRGYKTVQSKTVQSQPSSSTPAAYQAWSTHPPSTAQPQPSPQPTSYPMAPASALPQQTLAQPTAAYAQPVHSIPPPVPLPPPDLTSQPPPPSPFDPQRDLPDKQVIQMSFLWLSQNLHNWKFVGRYLSIRDAELERIEADNRGMTEQCYQMLTSWYRMSGRNATYQILGEVLLKTRNEDVYKEFVDKVNELEKEEL